MKFSALFIHIVYIFNSRSLWVYFLLSRLIGVLVHVTVGVSDLVFLVHWTHNTMHVLFLHLIILMDMRNQTFKTDTLKFSKYMKTVAAQKSRKKVLESYV